MTIRKLDKFQQFIKKVNAQPDLNVLEAKVFNRKLYTFFRDKYDDIASEVNGTIGFDEIYSNSIYQIESLNVMVMDNAIKLHTNNLIQTTLEEIEDIESVNEMEPEDCCDADKRNVEINQ